MESERYGSVVLKVAKSRAGSVVTLMKQLTRYLVHRMTAHRPLPRHRWVRSQYKDPEAIGEIQCVRNCVSTGLDWFKGV